MESIRGYIVGKHVEYSGMKPGMNRDISFSLNVSTAVSLSIAAACSRNSTGSAVFQTA